MDPSLISFKTQKWIKVTFYESCVLLHIFVLLEVQNSFWQRVAQFPEQISLVSNISHNQMFLWQKSDV